MMKKFSQKAIEKLNHYVYALKDPITNEVFYIGQGKENRVFSHVNEDMQEEKEKTKRILDIKSKGKEVIHEILHFGLTQKEAIASEATLINFIGKKNLTNIVSGQHAIDKYTVEEFEKIFAADSVEIKHNVLMIKITQYSKEFSENEIYDQVRGYWKISLQSAKKISYVFAIYKGLIKGIYKPIEWYKVDLQKNNINAPREHELNQGKNNGRIYFTGVSPEKKIIDYYIDKDVSKRIKNIQNPISYHFI